MAETQSAAFYAAVVAATALVATPLLGELVVQPAFTLGWDVASFCMHAISNGFL